MKLAQLFSMYSELQWGDSALAEVTGVTSDTRQVEEGSVFVAVKGQSFDGHDALSEVIKKGAVALVVHKDTPHIPEFNGVLVKSFNTRNDLVKILGKFYGYPTRDVFSVAVTGTNGKTSIAYMLECILQHFGWSTGILGTVDHHIQEHVWQSQLTTPSPEVLQKRLSEMHALKARAFVFEVSSHAIDQQRARGLDLDCAVFTNLSRDHLDYHENMESYFQAKQKLFTEMLQESNKSTKFAVINIDDEYGRKIEVSNQSKRISYGQGPGDFQFEVTYQGFDGSTFLLRTKRGEFKVHIPIPGLFSVYNATAALAVAYAAGISMDLCIEALSQFKGIPGRVQPVENNKNAYIFVDYAHTDDALNSVLKTLSKIKKAVGKGRLITIFGCGGDRDKGKRPLMMAAAMKYSDYVIVTSDNPRSEDPHGIIDEILSQTDASEKGKKYFVEADRKSALRTALNLIKEGDILLIAGKGHESTQTIGNKVLDFNDAQIIKELLV
ncbi:MAG: UDP-N-acetylmuramoyl-L-alanyl-D-glutamate--2,6-diaminopimelate ligase [Bdellovibrionaceae bacterium]|jgi:UDP-N-acetylmuramoyl-L-alanyl-D-glutamate--2,6-diaminopimelate ligase|nr:UDP-N-acetylmuramoyl-L-alanyl-D-glutamate--2,6-diaminopimelate ligase [Pseudobdellovibrionaceae bacterium]